MSVERTYSIQNLGSPDPFLPVSIPTQSGGDPGGNILLQGATLRTSTAFGRAATVKAGEDIRPALESLRSAGGGTLILLAGTHRPTYDIVGGDAINIIGEGIDQTIIDFGGGAYRVKYGKGAAPLEYNFKVANLTIKSSSHTNGVLYLEYVSNFVLDSVKCSNCTTDGATIDTGKNFTVINCSFESNGGDGLVVGETINSTEYFIIQNCRFVSNALSGFKIEDVNVSNGIITGCQAVSNTTGFFIDAGNTYSVIGCQAFYNTTGFNASATRIAFVGCTAGDCGVGFDINAITTSLTACSAYLNTTSDIDVADVSSGLSGEVTIVGCNFNENGGTAPGNEINMTDKFVQAYGNSMQSLVTSREIIKMVNNSGSFISAGEVVTFASAANGYEITRTTTVGDDKVLGVAISNMANTGTGQVLVKGKTTVLKVNGTTDIAIGDFLATYSVAGIAAKAVAGDMVFAIALEAYTTNDSNGVIDALIISPRLI